MVQLEPEAKIPRQSAAPTLLERLWSPIDIASLVVFRMAFGLLMLWEVWRYFDMGWIKRYYIDPQFFFTYFGFDWVRPWPGDGMYIHFAAMGLFAIFIAIGFLYRLSATLFFLGFTYVFLLDKTNYLNHFYLISLISFLMIFMPAHRAFSIDARLRPSLRADTVPAWTRGLLLFQLAVPYLYGGIAKINADWLAGEPLTTWLSGDDWFQSLSKIFKPEAIIFVLSFGGMMYDLCIVPLLLWKRTRFFAVIWTLAFHLINSQMFSIGVFPWFMIAATTLFLEPDWPRRLFAWFNSSTGGATLERDREGVLSLKASRPVALGRGQLAVNGALAIYVAVQVLVPLRHHLYPGPVVWTEEGHRFSWRMKLRDKEANVRFIAYSPITGKSWTVSHRKYLTSRQRQKMPIRPDMIHQFSRFLAEKIEEQGKGPVEIRVEAMVSVNGKEMCPMIDSTIDLSREPITLAPARWILMPRENLMQGTAMADAEGEEVRSEE